MKTYKPHPKSRSRHIVWSFRPLWNWKPTNLKIIGWSWINCFRPLKIENLQTLKIKENPQYSGFFHAILYKLRTNSYMLSGILTITNLPLSEILTIVDFYHFVKYKKPNKFSEVPRHMFGFCFLTQGVGGEYNKSMILGCSCTIAAEFRCLHKYKPTKRTKMQDVTFLWF